MADDEEECDDGGSGRKAPIAAPPLQSGLSSWNEVVREMKKVTWPSWKET